MSHIKFINLFADLGNPKTGGQVYDSRLFYELSEAINVQLIDDKRLNIRRTKCLYLGLLKLIPKLRKGDVIIFNSSWFAYFIPFLLVLRCLKPKVKTYTIHHHFRFFEFKGINKLLRKFLEILCLKLCNGVISPNPYTSELLTRYVKQSKIHILRMSFEKHKYKSSPSQRNLLYVGTIYKRKGIHKLIEAVGVLKEKGITDFQVNLVGSTNDRVYYNELQETVTKLRLQKIIRFWGRVSEHKLKELYSSAGWFVLPSFHEGYGMVIAEAMSYGIPVIAFNNSAIPFLVFDNYNGFLVENGSALELSEKIEKSMNSIELRERLSQGAKNTFKQLPDLTDFRKDVEEFIKKVSNE